MDEEEYDVIVLGTSPTLSILTTLLSIQGKKVLQVDSKAYYGGEMATIHIDQLYTRFYPGTAPPSHLGPNRYWNIDLVPKFTLRSSEIMSAFGSEEVLGKYVDWHPASLFVMQKTKPLCSHSKMKLIIVTATPIVKSESMSFCEKRRCKKFLEYVRTYEKGNPVTYHDSNLHQISFQELASDFSLRPNTCEFLGHGMALNASDEYITRPSIETVKKLKLFLNSADEFRSSPLVYPVYGCSSIIESLVRISAIYGSMVMLAKPIDKVLYNQDGKVVGILSGKETIRAPVILCEPSYALPKVRVTGVVIRAICILTHRVTETNSTCQIVIPGRLCSRRHDIYVTCIGSEAAVCPNNYVIATCCTQVETDTPEAELQPAFDLIGEIQAVFFQVHDMLEPVDDGRTDNLYVSRSCVATPYYDSIWEDVLSLHERVTGRSLKARELMNKLQGSAAM